MKKTMRWLALAGLSLSSGCLEVEGSAPEVCVVQRNIVLAPTSFVDPSALGAIGGLDQVSDEQLEAIADQLSDLLSEVLAVRTSFVFDDSGDLDFLTEEDVSASAHFRRISLTLTGGATETFGFVNALDVRLRSLPEDASATALPEVTLLSCTSDTCDFESDVISQDSQTNVDVVPYIDAGDLEFDILFRGTFPIDGWTMDAEICMDASAKIDVL